MFEIGDYAVCPGHGVGQVCDIEEKDLGGTVQSFYVIKVLANDMVVMVPTSTKDGIRKLVNGDTVGEVYTMLNDHEIKIDTSTWNRRYREYMLKIKSGSIFEVADVLRALFLLKGQKNLSFGEKKMLDQCKNLLAEEISITNGEENRDVKVRIDSCFSKDSLQSL